MVLKVKGFGVIWFLKLNFKEQTWTIKNFAFWVLLVTFQLTRTFIIYVTIFTTIMRIDSFVMLQFFLRFEN